MAPSNWSMVDNNFPSFSGKERPSEQIVQLTNYMQLLVEQLKYQLNNLDATNWNKRAMQSMQEDTTKDVVQNLTKVEKETKNNGDSLKKAEERIQELEEQMELEKNAQEARFRKMEKELKAAKDSIDKAAEAIRIDESGNIAIGAEGKTVALTGTVTVNGTAMGEGSGT